MAVFPASSSEPARPPAAPRGLEPPTHRPARRTGVRWVAEPAGATAAKTVEPSWTPSFNKVAYALCI